MRQATAERNRKMAWELLAKGDAFKNIYPEELEPSEIEILNVYPEDQRENLARVWRMKEVPFTRMSNSFSQKKQVKLNTTMLFAGIILFHSIGLHGLAHILSILMIVMLAIAIITSIVLGKELEQSWWVASIPLEYIKKRHQKTGIMKHVSGWLYHIFTLYMFFIAFVYSNSGSAWAIAYILLAGSAVLMHYKVMKYFKKLQLFHTRILEGYYNNNPIPEGW